MQRNSFYWWLNLKGPFSVFQELNVQKDIYRHCEACYYLGTEYKNELGTLSSRKDEMFSSLTGIK